MTGKELIERVVKPELIEHAWVKSYTTDKSSWWHVHWDEHLPKMNDVEVTIRINHDIYSR